MSYSLRWVVCLKNNFHHFFNAACQVPLGMESEVILDQQISASSSYDYAYSARNGRLNFTPVRGRAGGWLSQYLDTAQWFQVDLLKTTRVTGIATQGRSGFNHWITKYKLQYGDDGKTFRFYTSYGENLDKV